MSEQRREKGYNPSEASTSSGYRRTSKTPYLRSESERGHSSTKGKLKSVDYDSEYGSGSEHAASTSSGQPGSLVKSEIKSEPMDIHTEAEIKTESESGDAASTCRSTASTRGRRKEVIFVSRPSFLEDKRGTSGRQVRLQSNYFRMPTVPNWCLYQFRIDFEPEESRTAVRKGLLKLHKVTIGPYIFDGTVLYTTRSLGDKLVLESTRQSDGASIKIIIRFVGSLSREDPHYNVFFNIVMRKCLEHLRLQMVGRNYYDANNSVSIHNFRLELWPGYITAIRQYERDYMMCVEISHKVLHQKTLLHALNDCWDENRSNYKVAFSNNVLGLMVLTGYNNHSYRIEAVDFDVTPSSKFSLKSGEEISYLEYYKTKYEIIIKNATQPLLVTRTKPKAKNLGKGDLVYLVPELCRAIGLTDKMKEQFALMRELAVHTRLSPESRIRKLMSFNERLRREPKVVQELDDWQMQLDRNLVEVPARILPSERLIFGRNTIINCGQGDWTREMQRAPLLHCKELRKWVIITTERAYRNAENFVRVLQRVSHGLSLRVDFPLIHSIRDDTMATYVEQLEYVLSKNAPDLVLCVVSNNRSDRYAAIKKKCCLDRPVPSQVIMQKNLDGKNAMTVATKVAIQMNCKLGGSPWQIEMPLKGIMAIGFDICRDSNAKGREFLAMVATVDQTQTRYHSCITPYYNHEELGEQICAGVCKAVQVYRAHNRALPMYLIIYRDGVSDGQLLQVNEYEVENLKKKLEKLYYGPNFKMTYVLVSKNNTRLFLNGRNPPTGTIVDDVVTSPFKYDFFLVSQQVRQGTISPTSYNVISDNSGLSPDTIQNVTFKLTHMYYNCSSTVRVPAPCHYAKKFSFLVGRFLHKPPHSQLENQLYFL